MYRPSKCAKVNFAHKKNEKNDLSHTAYWKTFFQLTPFWAKGQPDKAIFGHFSKNLIVNRSLWLKVLCLATSRHLSEYLKKMTKTFLHYILFYDKSLFFLSDLWVS